jgi:hypothetical protein
MNPLAIRKRLLVAEANLLRADLGEDVRRFRIGMGEFSGKARSVGSTVSALLAGWTAVSLWRKRHRKGEAGGRSSLLRKALSIARLVSTLWILFNRGTHGDGSQK